MVNQVGLSRKHIFDAVEKSVERLGTYIDVLQIYRLDRDTPREEMMKALNDVIENNRSSKRAEADKFYDVLVHQREDALDKKIVGRVEEVAKKHNVSMACIATVWTIKKGVCPIIGLSSKERIDETVKNIHFKLSGEDAKYLEEVYAPKFRQVFRRYHTGCVTLMQKYNPKDHKHK